MSKGSNQSTVRRPPAKRETRAEVAARCAAGMEAHFSEIAALIGIDPRSSTLAQLISHARSVGCQHDKAATRAEVLAALISHFSAYVQNPPQIAAEAASPPSSNE